ncbi:hypothetical protein HDU76_009235, partial [Blyttiomyces sp. JEL0837]
AHGTWLVVEKETVHARPDKHAHGERSHWHVDHHHGEVTLRNSHTDEYLSCDENGKIYMSNTNHATDSKWFLERVENRVAIKSPHGGYLGAEDPNAIEKLLFLNNSHVRIHTERGVNELWEEDVI